MLDTIFRILKLSVIVLLAGIFMVSINTLTGLIVLTEPAQVVREFFGIFSCCMPFNASAVFGSLYSSCVGILSFLIAKKIFDLSSWSLSTT